MISSSFKRFQVSLGRVVVDTECREFRRKKFSGTAGKNSGLPGRKNVSFRTFFSKVFRTDIRWWTASATSWAALSTTVTTTTTTTTTTTVTAPATTTTANFTQALTKTIAKHGIHDDDGGNGIDNDSNNQYGLLRRQPSLKQQLQQDTTMTATLTPMTVAFITANIFCNVRLSVGPHLAKLSCHVTSRSFKITSQVKFQSNQRNYFPIVANCNCFHCQRHCCDQGR